MEKQEVLITPVVQHVEEARGLLQFLRKLEWCSSRAVQYGGWAASCPSCKQICDLPYEEAPHLYSDAGAPTGFISSARGHLAGCELLFWIKRTGWKSRKA